MDREARREHQPGRLILKVSNLTTELRSADGAVRAVDEVSFDLCAGETLGLVGESGSGKSLTCLSILNLLPDGIGRIVAGSIELEGKELVGLPDSAMRRVRGKLIGLILQDPMTSLNPVLTIGGQVGEAIRVAHRIRGAALRDRIVEALRRMRIPAPADRVKAYPHEMSGGMRQRVGGAIAMAGPPKVLIADEPTTALDATVQAQFLSLLRDVQRETGLAILFVTHDFGIVANMCDRVAVMYAGRIVELSPVTELFERPAHPYTEALLRSVPKLDEDVDRLYSIDGQPPALTALPSGCSFAARCPYARDICRQTAPPVVLLGDRHQATCWKLVDYGK
jgi:oligopeptide/dipeptide ABC transporter ATP-binding protein